MTDSDGRPARPETTRIAVDLLGGDDAPAVVVDGALLALDADPEIQLHLVGPREVADEGLPGVRKPALAALLPAQANPVVLLDVGASPELSATVLVQHAGLGAAYATRVLGLRAPRIGLLSIGTEPGKGDRARRSADEALRTAQPGYVGTVEGGDVPLGGPADVVVTDGFTGNALLKGIEGAFALAGGVAPPRRVPRAAALLGVAGTVVVCHGAASGTDLASGIALATRLHRNNLVEVSS